MTSSSDILILTIVQPDLAWEDPKYNLQHLDHLLDAIDQTDLIVLPEMFSSGFSMNPTKLSESMDGESVSWMKSQAIKHQAAVVGSLIIKENDHFFNRLLWITPNGNLEYYDKRHLFSFANEHLHFSAGNQRLITTLKDWKICPLICYDLRFPVWSRNQNLESNSSESEYDLLIYVANWPEARRNAWLTLLEARAHENQAYVLGVNRVGMDGNGIQYAGDSCLFSPRGEKLSDLKEYSEGIQTITIDLDDLKSYRKKFTAWKDKDNFELKK